MTYFDEIVEIDARIKERLSIIKFMAEEIDESSRERKTKKYIQQILEEVENTNQILEEVRERARSEQW